MVFYYMVHSLPTLTNGKHEQGVKKVKVCHLRCLSELGFTVQQSEETLGVSSQCSLQLTLWGITASDKFAYGCVLRWCKQLALHFLQCVRQSGAWAASPIWAHLNPVIERIKNIHGSAFFIDGPTRQYQQKSNFYKFCSHGRRSF